MTWNLPNAITTMRLAVTPVLVYLLFQPRLSIRLLAFILFVVAAVSDLWDGRLARERDQITEYGKIADPIADKLLLASALVPFYLLTRQDPVLAGIPLFGRISLWIVLVLLGREVLITGLRLFAVRRGEVVTPGKSGKYKAVFQNLFLGGTILWLAFRTGAELHDWSGTLWAAWEAFHGWFIAATLTIALVLTVYSMVVYLAFFHRLFTGERAV